MELYEYDRQKSCDACGQELGNLVPRTCHDCSVELCSDECRDCHLSEEHTDETKE